ncbi:hypothetical protein D3C81_1385690 [compost metagenome]
MVCIIVNVNHLRRADNIFKSSFDALKCCQSSLNCLGRNSQQTCYRNCCNSIFNIVNPRNTQMNIFNFPIGILVIEKELSFSYMNIGSISICHFLARITNLALEFQSFPYYTCATINDLVQKQLERFKQMALITVDIQMICIRRSYDRDIRMKCQK